MAGHIYVVGIGPGAYEKMTIEAVNVLKNSDVIAGYTVYVDLVKDHFGDKEFLTTPMRQEVERCRMALEEAAKGRKVYGMQRRCRRIWDGRPDSGTGSRISGSEGFHHTWSDGSLCRSSGIRSAFDSRFCSYQFKRFADSDGSY